MPDPTDVQPRPELPFSTTWRDRIVLVVVLAVGGALTFLAGSSLQQSEAMRLNERKTAATQAVVSALDLELTRATEAVRNAGLMIESNPQITRDRFNQYMQKLVENQLSVNLVEWQPIVPAKQLEQFESAARAGGLANYQVVQPDASGKNWEPVHGRDEYVPVLFAWPQDYQTIGQDMSFSPERMASKILSRSTAQPMSSGVFPFMKDGMVDSGVMAVAISTTVFDANQTAMGYLAAIVDLPTLFQKAARQADLENVDLLVFSTATPAAAPIYARYGDDSNLKLRGAEVVASTAGDPSVTMDFAHQSFRVVLHPRPGFHAESAENAASLAYASGIGLTLLLFAIVVAHMRMNAQLSREISSRSMAEKALQHRQNMLERTENMARLASFEWDVDANIVTWSPEMFRIFGRDPALGVPNLQGQVELYTSESTQALFDAVSKAVSDGTPYELELMRVHPNGEHRPCLVKGYPERDDSGRVVRVAGLVQDITERKQAESKLQLAAGVFSHAREGIFITNAQGVCVDVNEAFTRITGYSHEEATGQNPRTLSSGLQDQDFYTAMWDVLTGQGYWSGEIWNRRKNGEVYAELLTISEIRDVQGKAYQYVALFSDITASKTHQRELERIAHFDALTNLPNRVLFADRLRQAMAQEQRRGQQLAVVYIDLDGFKAINDRHGHETGDQVLIALAMRMKLALREGDTLARLGGDEFVAVLIDLEGTSASVPLLNRLLETAALPVQVGEQSLKVSASLGVTFYQQAQGIDADQLLRQADQAMYQAKQAGKNRYHMFAAGQDHSARDHQEK